MIANRVIAGIGLGALVAAALAVTPALAVPGRDDRQAPKPVTLGFDGGIGSFTPASADPRLAAALAKSGLSATGFRFTPSDAGSDGDDHDITVAVRARSSHGASAHQASLVDSDPSSSVRLSPIAYNLGVAVGWKRFALSGDVAHIDLAGEPGSRQSTDVGVSYTGHRVSARVKLQDDRPIANSGPMLVQEGPSQTIDVGGSYSLTRNLDVTAGVRYKSERDSNRLPLTTDDRRDSQAVYIGTAFRF
jgi:hypothetical protein